MDYEAEAFRLLHDISEAQLVFEMIYEDMFCESVLKTDVASALGTYQRMCKLIGRGLRLYDAWYYEQCQEARKREAKKKGPQLIRETRSLRA